MFTRISTIGLFVFAVAVSPANGQTVSRRANVSGGGSPDRGSCTVEIQVDGAAEVEVRGNNGNLRNLSGGQPQWRRFDCTSPMPANPQNFRFLGMDGRGSQELVRGPQNGGVAVVRIQDPNGGPSDYRFELTWGAGGDNRGQGPGFGGDRRPDQRQEERQQIQRMSADQAIRTCQESVRQQAGERFRGANLSFRKTAMDDRPGQQDFVTGIVDIRRGYDRDQIYRFSCAMNFENGVIRSVQLDPIEQDRYVQGYGDARQAANRAAITSCQRAVEGNLQQKGYQHVDFLSINTDTRSGRADVLVGAARADIRFRSDSFDFSCTVDPKDGDVRSVDVRPGRRN